MPIRRVADPHEHGEGGALHHAPVHAPRPARRRWARSPRGSAPAGSRRSRPPPRSRAVCRAPTSFSTAAGTSALLALGAAVVGEGTCRRSGWPPRTSWCSAPMGTWRGATAVPKTALSWVSVREKEARSRSSLLTKKARAMPSSPAMRHRASVCTSTPSTPDTTNRARSAARRAARASPTKSESPGVSMMLTRWPAHSKGAIARLTEEPRLISSGSKSVTVFPSSMRPMRVVTPAREEECLGERGLPAAAVADEHDVPDAVRGQVNLLPGPGSVVVGSGPATRVLPFESPPCST